MPAARRFSKQEVPLVESESDPDPAQPVQMDPFLGARDIRQGDCNHKQFGPRTAPASILMPGRYLGSDSEPGCFR